MRYLAVGAMPALIALVVVCFSESQEKQPAGKNAAGEAVVAE